MGHHLSFYILLISQGRLENQAALVLFCCSAVFYLTATLVKGRIAGVEILGVEGVLGDAEGVGETIKGEWILRYPLFLNFPFDIQAVL